MAKNVYELRGSMSNIEADTELVFPNVQTCVALVLVCGGQLVGVHLTLGDRERLSKVARLVLGRYGTPSDLYVIGPILGGGYNVSGLANFGGRPHVCNTPGFIDVRALYNGGQPTFETRPAGGGGWTALPSF